MLNFNFIKRKKRNKSKSVQYEIQEPQNTQDQYEKNNQRAIKLSNDLKLWRQIKNIQSRGVVSISPRITLSKTEDLRYNTINQKARDEQYLPIEKADRNFLPVFATNHKRGNSSVIYSKNENDNSERQNTIKPIKVIKINGMVNCISRVEKNPFERSNEFIRYEKRRSGSIKTRNIEHSSSQRPKSSHLIKRC